MDRCEAHAVNPDRRCKRRGQHAILADHATQVFLCWQHTRVLERRFLVRLHVARAAGAFQVLALDSGGPVIHGQTHF